MWYIKGMNRHATRRRNIFDPAGDRPYEISRGKIETFLSCPRCFYLDRRLGVDRPRSFPFNLNNAVDLLLKKEFDAYRKKQKPHPILVREGLDVVPFAHENMDTWRDPFVGVRHHHEASNFVVFGGVDDVWADRDGALIIADYKATSKEGEVSLDAPWQRSYKNQMEMYQWLFRQNGFTVADTGYFVYLNGDQRRAALNGALHFTTKLIPYAGTVDWIPDTLAAIRETLVSDAIPPIGSDCDFCPYRDAAGRSFRDHVTKS